MVACAIDDGGSNGSMIDFITDFIERREGSVFNILQKLLYILLDQVCQSHPAGSQQAQSLKRQQNSHYHWSDSHWLENVKGTRDWPQRCDTNYLT